MIFRRPELEKDNPIAPQPYIGPRRRLAMARAAAAGELSEAGDMEETLQTLTKAASRFVNSLPKARKADTGLKALRDALAQVEQILSVKTAS
jgi:hypothetical protein